MQVRTRRDGIDGGFASASLLHDITSDVLSSPDSAAASGIVYGLLVESRTAFLFRRAAAFSPARAARDEVERHDAFVALADILCETFRPLLTSKEVRELPARWVIQSINDMRRACSCRETVTLLDRNAIVRDTSSGLCYRIAAMADMTGGEHWVEIVPVTETEPSANTETNININTGAGAETESKAPCGTDNSNDNSNVRRRVDCALLALCTPQPLHLDALLPADEASSARGTSTCLFLAATLAVQRPHALSTYEGDLPKRVALRMSECAWRARKSLADALARPESNNSIINNISNINISSGLSVEVCLAEDHVTLRHRGLEVSALQRTLRRLAYLWDSAAAAAAAAAAEQKESNISEGPSAALAQWGRAVEVQSAAPGATVMFLAEEPFFLQVFAMLLRYRTLFGDLGYNQGPQAAIPPVVLAHLHRSFAVRCEAFASPLNAQLPRYASLFPDTDSPFGSLGAFFDLDILAGHYEVNPPFDYAVLRRLEERLREVLEAQRDSAASLLFVVVLPSHDMDAGESEARGCKRPHAKMEWTSGEGCEESNRVGKRRAEGTEVKWNKTKKKEQVSAERAMRESPFCLAHVVCEADESVYVDGHQHVLRVPLFCIGTPTRLIVLGNTAARRKYGNAAERLSEVRETWRRFTTDSRNLNVV